MVVFLMEKICGNEDVESEREKMEKRD